MMTLPKNFERYTAKAIQELGERVYEFNPNLILGILRAGKPIGVGIQYYIKMAYGESVALDYIRVFEGYDKNWNKILVIDKNLEGKEGMMRGRKIALVDDVSSGIHSSCNNTMGIAMRKIEKLGAYSVAGYCLLSSTTLSRVMGKSTWDGDGWHNLFSENLNMAEFKIKELIEAAIKK